MQYIGDINKFIQFLPINDTKIRVVCHSSIMRKFVEKRIGIDINENIGINFNKDTNQLYDQNIWGIKLNTEINYKSKLKLFLQYSENQ